MTTPAPSSFPPKEAETKATVRAMKGGGLWVGLPPALLATLVTAVTTWFAAHAGGSPPPNDELLRKVQACEANTAEIRRALTDAAAEQRQFRAWAETQISVLLVRSDVAARAPR
jgi:hypothetical protein